VGANQAAARGIARSSIILLVRVNSPAFWCANQSVNGAGFAWVQIAVFADGPAPAPPDVYQGKMKAGHARVPAAAYLTNGFIRGRTYWPMRGQPDRAHLVGMPSKSQIAISAFDQGKSVVDWQRCFCRVVGIWFYR